MKQNSIESQAECCSTPFGLLMLDDSFVITSVDARFMHMFDCQQNNLIGVSLESLFNKKNRKADIDFHRNISCYHSGYIEQAIELQIADSDYYVMMRLIKQGAQWLAFFENLHGQDAGLIGHLFSTLDRYKSVIKNAADGIVLLNEHNELIEFNRSFFDILAIQNKQGILLSKDALLGRDFFDLTGDSFIAVQAVIEAALAKKRACLGYSVDFRNFSLALDITPIFQPAKGFIGTGIVIHDRTAQCKLEKRAQELAENEIKLIKEQEAERLVLETQLRQAQKMESIGQLTGGIAHDFNNILTSVLGNAEMGLDVVKDLGEPKLQKYMTNLIRSAERARDLIRQMLVFSRGQRGEFKILPLAQVVYDAVKLLGLSLPSSVQIQIEIDDNTGIVKRDSLQIEQVLMNLCMNAHDAMEGAGNVTISLKNRLDVNELCSGCSRQFEGDFVELAISDNGCGIDQQTQERMFEPFYTTKEVGKGSGMGLSMVHGIVHEHDGHVLVESKNGRGATFRLLFPMLPDTFNKDEKTVQITNSSTNLKQLSGSVLLVDDEELVTEFMRDFLQSRGLTVTATTNSREARQIFIKQPAHFDLVITDQTMPGMTGIELAWELLQARPEIPIILYTGHSEKISQQQVFQHGIKGYLKKPVDTRLLVETIRHLLLGADSKNEANSHKPVQK